MEAAEHGLQSLSALQPQAFRGESTFQQLRHEVHCEEFHRLAREIMEEFPEYKAEIGSVDFMARRDAIRQKLAERADALFSEREILDRWVPDCREI